MQNEIYCTGIIYLCMRAQRTTEMDRGKENIWALKLSLVKCQECGLFVAFGHIYASWCHPTAVCLGGSTHTPTHRPSYSCSLQPNCLSPLCLKVLSDITGTETSSHSEFLVVSVFSSPFTDSPVFPFQADISLSKSFIGYTHLFTRHLLTFSFFLSFLCPLFCLFSYLSHALSLNISPFTLAIS